MKVSIIVAIYKVEKYLPQCIESIIHQTFHDIEIILVDDGSPDNSGAICDEYAKKDERIRVIHQENAGVSVARNRGIAESSTDWIVMIDGDDWLPKDAIEILYNAIEDGCDVVVGTFNIHYPDKTVFVGEAQPKDKVYRYNMDTDREKILCYTLEEVEVPELREIRCNFSSPWAKIYRKSMLVENGIEFPAGTVRGEDEIFNLYVMQYAHEVIAINRPVYAYRFRENSTCGALATAKFQPDIFEVWSNGVLKFLDKFDYRTKLADVYNLFAYRLVRRMLGICVRNYAAGEVSRKEVIQQIRNITQMPVYQEGILKTKKSRHLSMAAKGMLLIMRMHLYSILVTAWSAKIKRDQKNGVKARV